MEQDLVQKSLYIGHVYIGQGQLVKITSFFDPRVDNILKLKKGCPGRVTYDHLVYTTALVENWQCLVAY